MVTKGNRKGGGKSTGRNRPDRYNFQQPPPPVSPSMSQPKTPVFDRMKAKARITATGRSVADVARSLGLERQTVGHWLRGRGEPNMRQIYQLAKEVGCHWLELVDDEAVVLNDPAERQRVERIRAASPAVQAMIDALLTSVEPPRN